MADYNGVRIILPIDRVLKPYEKNGVMYFPVAIKGLMGKNGSYIKNCLVEIPEGTQYIECTLYTYKGEFKIKNALPSTVKK